MTSEQLARVREIAKGSAIYWDDVPALRAVLTRLEELEMENQALTVQCGLLDQVQAELGAVQDDLQALRAFAQEVIGGSAAATGTLTLGAIHECAVRHGLIFGPMNRATPRLTGEPAKEVRDASSR